MQNFFKKEFLQVTSLTGISTLIRMLSQLVISKVIVVIIGPAGLVMFGQLTNLSTIFQTFSVGGMTTGVTKYLAEYSGEKEQQKVVISSSVKITFYFSMATSLAIILFYKIITRSFFHDKSYEVIVLLLGGAISFIGFNNLFISILNGLRKYKAFIVISIVNSVAGLLITVVLTYFFSIYGALIAYILSPALTLFYTLSVIKKETGLNKSFFTKPLDKGTIKKLSSYSVMLINNSLVGSLAQISIRAIIIKHITTNAAGIWEAMNRLSSAYLLIITSSIQVYYLPTLSAIKDKATLTKEILSAQKNILPACVVIFTVIYFLRVPIIHLLFSKDFNELNDLIIYQLIGDLIKVAAWLISYVMYARSMTKALVITDDLFTLTNIMLIFLMIDSLGLKSIYIAYIINSFIYLLFMIVFYKYYVFREKR